MQSYLGQNECESIWDEISSEMPLPDFPGWGESQRIMIARKFEQYFQSRGYKCRFWDGNYQVQYDVPNDLASVMASMM